MEPAAGLRGLPAPRAQADPFRVLNRPARSYPAAACLPGLAAPGTAGIGNAAGADGVAPLLADDSLPLTDSVVLSSTDLAAAAPPAARAASKRHAAVAGCVPGAADGFHWAK